MAADVLKLNYGGNRTLELEMPRATDVQVFAGPAQQHPDGVDRLVAAAIETPLGMPPLTQVVLPSDRVAVVIGTASDQLAQVVAGLIEQLVKIGVEPSNITCLWPKRPDEDRGAVLKTAIADRPWHNEIHLDSHNPDDPQHLAYLAQTPAGKSIYLNRSIVDADLVLPVSLHTIGPEVYLRSVHGEIFPQFSDRVTQRRLDVGTAATQKVAQEVLHEVDHAGWLLGVMFILQVVPGASRPAVVLAGEPSRVWEEAETASRQYWTCPTKAPADLVVATLPSSRPSWRDLARALQTACDLVEEDGSVALISDLNDPLGPILQQLRTAEDPWDAVNAATARIEDAVEDDEEASAVPPALDADRYPAEQLCKAIGRAHVYLMSDRPEDEIEDLGITPIASPSELARLISRHERCLVLSNPLNTRPARRAAEPPSDE